MIVTSSQMYIYFTAVYVTAVYLATVSAVYETECIISQFSRLEWMWRNSGMFNSFWWISRAWPTLDWTKWWLWRLHCLWLSSSLSSCCHGSITWSLLGLFTRPKEGRRLMAVKPVGTLVVERILFRNLCPPIKTKLSDKVASCSFAAPFSFYFVTVGTIWIVSTVSTVSTVS